MNVLQDTVLVLNKNWQAIDTMSVETAFCNLFRGVATAIDAETLRPVTFEEWRTLPIRPTDKFIGTTRGPVRVPTVIACVTYAKMPKKSPKLTTDNVRKRDGNRCQYTNRVLGPGEGNLDHVVAESRGGATSWENLVWCDRQINQRKGNKSLDEVGLKLVRRPKAPGTVPASVLIERRPDKPEWNHFLIH